MDPPAPLWPPSTQGAFDCRDPFEALDHVTDQLIFDILDILKADGFQARIRFFETN